MTLTQEENDFLTRVGPGQPAGELLRRYWYPVAIAQDLTDEQPTQFVRAAGRRPRAVPRQARARRPARRPLRPPRRLPLLRPRRRARDLAAPTTAGSTTPAATSSKPRPSATTPSSSTSSSRPIPSRSSSACTGPTWARCPRPLIPRYDVWVRTDGHRRIVVHPAAGLQLAAGDGELGRPRAPADPAPGVHRPRHASA